MNNKKTPVSCLILQEIIFIGCPGEYTLPVKCIELKDSGDFLYDQYRRRMSDCHDSYDASLFRIQGDFGKLIDDLIQKCYYENNPYDE